MSHIKKQSATNLIEPYAGEWVAFTSDQKTIVAHSRNLKAALKQAHKSGENSPIWSKPRMNQQHSSSIEPHAHRPL